MNKLIVAYITLDLDNFEVYKHGELIKISPMEYKLLNYFMLNSGRTISASELLREVWKSPLTEYDTHAHIVVIGYLRKKLGTDFIENKWKFGYRINPKYLKAGDNL